VLVTRWHPLPDDDAYRYDFIARALADGGGYVHLTGDPTAFWPPGYPVLLATAYVLFGQHVIVAQVLNVALGTATVWLVYLIGRRLFGHPTALLGAGIVACFPSLICFTGVTLSEITFTFLALLGIYLLVIEGQHIPRVENPRLPASLFPRLPLLLAAGLALGMAALTRGQALLLPLVLVPFWLRSGARWGHIGRKLAVLAIGMAVIVTPWTVRNAIQLDSPVLISTNAGVDFWIGHHDSATGNFDFAVPIVVAHPELSSAAREVRANSDGFRKGAKYAVTHPAQEFVLPFKKFFWLYYNDREGLRWNEEHGEQNFLPGPLREGLIALSNVYYFALAGVVVLGARRWFSARDPGRLLLISLVVYWTGIHLVFFGNPRFHAPIMPVVALLGALALLPQPRPESAATPRRDERL
jgi:4-amino-4-deoxy-L-arabinose transferase-like glycosyltransferase